MVTVIPYTFMVMNYAIDIPSLPRPLTNTITLVDAFCMGKYGPDGPNNDIIHIGNDFVAVIDGATSKAVEVDWGNTSSARIAAGVIDQTLSDLAPDATIDQAVDEMTARIYAIYQKKDVVDQVEQFAWERLSASFCAYSVKRHEIWSVGDAPFKIDGYQPELQRPHDQAAADARAARIQYLLLNGATVDELLIDDQSREYILPMLRGHQNYQNDVNNHPLAHAVIDGFQVPDWGRKVIKPDGDIGQLILASDGYPKLKPSLSESEQYLKRIIEQDPLMYRLHPSTKGVMDGQVSFDDRSYLRLKFDNSPPLKGV